MPEDFRNVFLHCSFNYALDTDARHTRKRQRRFPSCLPLRAIRLSRSEFAELQKCLGISFRSFNPDSQHFRRKRTPLRVVICSRGMLIPALVSRRTIPTYPTRPAPHRPCQRSSGLAAMATSRLSSTGSCWMRLARPRKFGP